MTEKEAKEFILKQWKVSSGSRITAMLNRYWKLQRESKEAKNQINKIKTAEQMAVFEDVIDKHSLM
jgi:hypothetical protein